MTGCACPCASLARPFDPSSPGFCAFCHFQESCWEIDGAYIWFLRRAPSLHKFGSTGRPRRNRSRTWICGTPCSWTGLFYLGIFPSISTVHTCLSISSSCCEIWTLVSSAWSWICDASDLWICSEIDSVLSCDNVTGRYSVSSGEQQNALHLYEDVRPPDEPSS